MPVRTLSLLNTNSDGSVEAHLVSDSTAAILKVLSIIYSIPLEKLEADVYIKDGSYVLDHRYETAPNDLLDTDLVKLSVEKVCAVGRAIHDRLEDPQLGVFNTIKMRQVEFDSLIQQFNENYKLFHDLGFFDNKELKQSYLNSVRDIIDNEQDGKQYLVRISAVCIIKEQPYADFYRLNEDGTLRRRAEKIPIIGCHTTLDDAIKLDELRLRGQQGGKDIVLKVTLKKKRAFGKPYELLSYQIVTSPANLELGF